MFLSDPVFSIVIDATPLVSLDLIVRNSAGQILLGERMNRPAQGYWFVPGGRIRKMESLSSAFERLTREELGIRFELADAVLLGPFDHFYQDSVFGDSPSTHYVAIAYELLAGDLINDLQALPQQQHGRYRWFIEEELLADVRVHPHTKAYLG